MPPTKKKTKKRGSIKAKKRDRRRKTNRPYTKPAHNPSWWPKGKSAHPEGRPRLTPEQVATTEAFRQACRERTPEAMLVIEELMQLADRDGVRLNAAQYVIDQGQGTAAIRAELSGPNGGPIATQNLPLTKEQIKEELIRRGLPTDILTGA